jgi:hypothetical protein
MANKKKELSEEDVDDLLDQAFAKQDQIHHKCEMRDDPKKKQKEWEEKYGKK